MLNERASGDRNNLRNEINKLKSFALNKQAISYDQVKELTNMAGNYQNDYIVNICLNGDKKRLNKTIGENNFFPEDFFILLKTFNKKIHRLLKIKILNPGTVSVALCATTNLTRCFSHRGYIAPTSGNTTVSRHVPV